MIPEGADSDLESLSDDFDSTDEDEDDDSEARVEKRKVDATVIDFVAIQPKHVTNCRLFLMEPEVKVEVKQEPEEDDTVQEVSEMVAAAMTLDEVEKVIKVEAVSEDEEEVNQPANISIPDIKPDLDALLRNASKAAAAHNKNKADALVIKTEPKSPEVDLAAAAKEISINLMSPDAFVGAGVVSVKSEPLKDEPAESLSGSLKARLMRSGNSSPSREVQDILEDSEEAGEITFAALRGSFPITVATKWQS